MSKKTKTAALRIACLVLGALINYCYLLLLGRVNFNNAVFLVIFSGVFAVLATEFVSALKIIDINRFAIFASADERMIPDNRAASPQTIWLALLFLVAIAIFQKGA